MGTVGVAKWLCAGMVAPQLPYGRMAADPSNTGDACFQSIAGRLIVLPILFLVALLVIKTFLALLKR
jgi:hypothetical protein